MLLKELTEKLNIIASNADTETEITSVCYDSRKAAPGSLFVAIKGFQSDGHDFIGAALEKGAAVVLCESVPQAECRYIQVKDSREALAAVSCAFYGYPAGKMKIIGVTGTSGKTTTTNLVRHIIEETLGVKTGLIGTNGNFIGNTEYHTEHTTPESLELQELFAEMHREECEYAIMEVSSHSLALSRVAGINFDTAAFTNLSRDHLDFHITMENYAAEKRKIFSMCRCGCVNLDDDYSKFMLQEDSCPFITFSTVNKEADLYADNIEYSPQGVSFRACYKGATEQMFLGIPGVFSVYNALCTIAICLSEGLTLKQISASLATAEGVKGRVETVPTGKDYSVIIDYSHKPDGLEQVLNTLRPVTKGKLICLFGCGGDRDRTKRPIMAAVAAKHSDFVVVTSDNPRTEKPEDIIEEILPGFKGFDTPYKVITNRPEAICWALDKAEKGDVVLLAGKGHEDYQIIGHDKIHMDEREIVAGHLNLRK